MFLQFDSSGGVMGSSYAYWYSSEEVCNGGQGMGTDSPSLMVQAVWRTGGR